MSTPNFRTMKDFPLWVVEDEEVCKYSLGTEDEYGNPYTEYSCDDINLAWDIFWGEMGDVYIDSIQNEINKLNDTLKWYKVELKSGYYNGVQIYVDTKWYDISNWDDEDCDVEFDLNKADTIKMIDCEKNNINEWFKEIPKQYGFEELICLGVFSNGEAIYKYKEEMLKGK